MLSKSHTVTVTLSPVLEAGCPPLVTTDISILTVRVHDTLWPTARDGVWLGDEAGQAAADWVPWA